MGTVVDPFKQNLYFPSDTHDNGVKRNIMLQYNLWNIHADKRIFLLVSCLIIRELKMTSEFFQKKKKNRFISFNHTYNK